MKKFFRFRHWLLIGGSALVILYLYLTDPNNGSLTAPIIAKIATPIIAVWFAHLARKALFDYIDLWTVFKKARETATGAGLVFLGICIVIFGLLGLFGNQVYAQDVSTYIPQQAYTHVSTVVSEQKELWRDHPKLGPLQV